jgi:hypothetical protein
VKLALNQKQNDYKFYGLASWRKNKKQTQGISSYKDGAVSSLATSRFIQMSHLGKNEVDAVLSNYEDPSAAQFC